jgi:hypothetical protein
MMLNIIKTFFEITIIQSLRKKYSLIIESPFQKISSLKAIKSNKEKTAKEHQ